MTPPPLARETSHGCPLLWTATLAFVVGACSANEAPAANEKQAFDGWQGRCGSEGDHSGSGSAPEVGVTIEAHVTDLANILSEDAERALEAELAAYERETCHQYVVLTVPSLGGVPIEAYSLAVTNENAIGHAKLNNGLMVLVAHDDHKSRIELGCGLESVISDARAAEVMSSAIPHFRHADFEAGIRASLEPLMALGRTKPVPAELRPAVCQRDE